MGNFKPRWRAIAQVTLFSAAAFLVCGTELAQGTTPVNGYVIVNPISVCSGGLCAPYGVSCTRATGAQVCTQSPAPSSATTTTPIGFVDADTNANLTRAFWAQAGIDVAFFPVQSYTSPTNAIDPSWNNIKDLSTGKTFTYPSTGNYQTLHQVNISCADGTPLLTSPDFQTLTQHSVCTEHGGLSGTYSKLANPPAMLSSPPPLAINGCGGACNTKSNAIDVFFINTIVAPLGDSSVGLYGFSWINGDGVSINKLPFTIVSPRFDNLAHEIGHALGLDHGTFGATSDPTNNLMLAGTSRFISANSGCLKPMPDTCSSTTLSCPGGALYDLDYTSSTFNPCSNNTSPQYDMLADHLTPESPAGTPCTNLPSCNNQEGAAALSPFINTTLPSQANAGAGECNPFCMASLATTSTPSSSATPLAGTPAPLPIKVTAFVNPIDLNNQQTPDKAADIFAVIANGPLSFSGNSPITQIGGTGCQVDVNGKLVNCVVTVTSVEKLGNNTGSGNQDCDKTVINPTPSAQCVKVTYSAGFGPGINVILAVDFNKDATTIINNNLLAGTGYTTIDAKGVATTTVFGTVSSGVFTADSTKPDFKHPIVFTDLANFQNASAVKFSSPPFNNQLLAQCTPPLADPITGAPTFQLVKIKGKLVPICPDGNLPAGE